MLGIPEPLVSRLPSHDRAALSRLLDVVDSTLQGVYSEGVLDYQESRGDDSQLFGFRIYKHERFALLNATADDDGIDFVEDNGAYHLRIGPLQIRVDSLGHFAHDDVRSTFPDASPSKRAFGSGNADQLRFEFSDVGAPPPSAAYLVNRLTIGHFGNPLEGLVKWYIGAWRTGADGEREWLWIERQDDLRRSTPRLASKRTTIVPFDQKRPAQVNVGPRRSA